jgi:Protein of unknown function (DUF2948)
MDVLKFAVLDEEDLEVASAHLQDAVVKVADVHWRPGEKRLVVALNRFDWESTRDTNNEYQRRRSALRFERVLSCKCQHVNPERKDEVLNLLAVEFQETEAPSGVIILSFSGGATLRLDVECLEAELADLGPTWSTSVCPFHAELDEPAAKSERH